MGDSVVQEGTSDGAELIVTDGGLSELMEGTQTSTICQHMDITESLSTLRDVLESRLLINLQEYQFFLQDTTPLDASKNLVDQCVQGEGLVQVNVEISYKNGLKKINIVDVLKPADDIGGLSPSHDGMDEDLDATAGHASPLNSAAKAANVHMVTSSAAANAAATAAGATASDEQNVTRWVVSSEFKVIMDKERIPQNPLDWQPEHTKRWYEWAVKEFQLCETDSSQWLITGKELLDMTHQQFTEKVKYDFGDIFWTHLELLRKCKFVAIIQNEPAPQPKPSKAKTDKTIIGKMALLRGKNKSAAHRMMTSTPGDSGSTGSNGQIQLWQFLLELLTDKDAREYIQWVGDHGEFRLNNPEMVAQMWGLRKNKPTMNYEKLSRALRYYYDGDMISKVNGKRFVYKFVCDLKQLIGYSAAELNHLVMEAEQRKIALINMPPHNAIEIGSMS